MTEQKISITIYENGKIIADTEGFKGQICVSEIEELLEGIAQVEKIDKKPDYYETDAKIKTTSKVVQR